MKLTTFSLRNPLAVGLIALALAIFGFYAYLTMSISVVPNITAPAAIVTTADPGADPATIETQLTQPIEDAIASLSNIDTLTSTSSQGLSVVTVNFTSNVNPDLVIVDVERAVNSVRGRLPTTANQPSVVKEDTTTALPVMHVVLWGPQPLDQVESVAENQVQRAFQRVGGVGSVGLSGGPTREIWVESDPLRLQSFGLDFNVVQQALQASQISQPAGALVDVGNNVNVRLNALAGEPQALGDIVVNQIPGATSSLPASPIRLKDVATIVDTHAPTTVIDRYNGAPAVTLTITRLPDANTLSVSRGIRQQIERLEPDLPPDMRLDVVTDLATYTQQSFNTIQRTLIEAVLLTGVILLAFLHTWRSTFIVLLAIPTSLLTTLGLMDVLGLNLNLFSMLALTLSVGILVDDSIVVIENISRHLALREPPILAAITGRNEIALAAITITLVDVVVYVPIAVISGRGGQIIRPFALVIASATLTSLLVSFTLTPLLASRFLSLEDALKRGGGPVLAFGRWWDAQFGRVERGYRALLRAALAGRLPVFGRCVGTRWLVILIGFASLVAGLAVLRTGRVGVDIFPSGDQSEVDVTLVMPPSTDITSTDAMAQQLESQLRTYPEVSRVYSHTGSGGGALALASGGGGGDTSQLTVLLVPPGQRQRSAADLATGFRQDLSAMTPGATIRTALPNPFGFGGFGGQAIQVTVDGPDPDTLNNLVAQITAAVAGVPGAVDVNNSNQALMTEYDLNIDRARAANLGISAQAAALDLTAAVSGIKVSQFQQPGQSNVDIRLIASDAFRASTANLGRVPVLSTSGTLARLDQLGTIGRVTTPTRIAHDNRERSVTVSASAADGYSVGGLQSAIQQRLAAIPLPPGYRVIYNGQAAQGAQTFGDVFAALGFGLLLMYMLMALLFGSLTLPLAVLMSLPLAVVGALGAMGLSATNFTLFSLLGVSLLMGLVGKNAILLVDYTDTLRKRGNTRMDALLEAGPTRLRPILMTTLSVIFALVPVASGIEAGSELLKAAAIVLIGGLLTSTLLTLVFVPAMYTIFDDLQQGFRRLTQRGRVPRSLEPVEVAILRGDARAGEPAQPASTQEDRIAM